MLRYNEQIHYNLFRSQKRQMFINFKYAIFKMKVETTLITGIRQRGINFMIMRNDL